MNHLGEIISLGVAASWTITALFADKASHRLGSNSTNVIRLTLAIVFLAIILWIGVGHPYPVYANRETWYWLTLSALVGYVFGDWCLFNCYLSVGARFGQLFMTLAPPIAAIAAWGILGENLSWKAILAMGVTLCGIAISILSKEGGDKVHLTLPLKGVLLGLGAGLGQGVGLVLSKIGLQHYESALPPDAPPLMSDLMPFAATMIRAVVGALGFLMLMAFQRKLTELRSAVNDGKGLGYALVVTLFGPVLGVSLSLLALQYTHAGIASTLMALTPVFILIPYAVIYKQRIRFREILGVVVSMSGIALFFLI
ncbi:MAG: DMT family transporter [Bacteroidales bacterium]|nr:DMT family transporter [Bacteroidales bacterium]